LLVNPEDVGDISNGINKLLSDSLLRTRLIEKGLVRVKLFNWDNSRQIWNDSINKAIGNN